MIYALSFSIGIIVVLGLLLVRESNNKKPNENVVCVGEILDEYFTTDSLELELSYPVWEVCNSMRDSPLNWKKDGKGYWVNNKIESRISVFNGFNDERIHYLRIEHNSYSGEDLSGIDNKCILAQLEVLTEFYKNIDNIIDSDKSDNFSRSGRILVEPDLTIAKIINELENL